MTKSLPHTSRERETLSRADLLAVTGGFEPPLTVPLELVDPNLKPERIQEA